MDKKFSDTICLIEFSSNTTHIHAYNPQTKEDIIKAQSHGTKLGHLQNGKLNRLGYQQSLNLLRDHQDTIAQIPENNIRVIGTGALRDASDTHKFKNDVRSIIGMTLDVIPGAEEATYSAIGVQSSFDNAQGVIWDMGGRSSEFAIIENGEISHQTSLALGSRTISEQNDPLTYIRNELEKLPTAYKEKSHSNLYVIGGTPRRLMGEHQNMEASTQNDIHGYTTQKNSIKNFAQTLLDTEENQRSNDSVFNDRVQHVAPLFIAILDTIPTQNVIASKNGTRAGILYELEQSIAHTQETKPTTEFGNNCEHN